MPIPRILNAIHNASSPLASPTQCFAPIYAAYILKQKWWTFYAPLLRGMLSSVIVLAVFMVIEVNVTIGSWLMLIVWAVVAGAIGYVINYIIVLNKNERQMVADLIKKKLKR